MPGLEDDDDYNDFNLYSVLNVSKDATPSEIRSSYYTMCTLFHPDKHQGSVELQACNEIFSRIQKAYEVLSDPKLREVYDKFGHRGLLTGREIILRTRSSEELKEELDAIWKRRSEEMFEALTHQKASILTRVDLTDIFEPYQTRDDDTIPKIFIERIALKQSFQVPLTDESTILLGGSCRALGGNGSSTSTVGYRHYFPGGSKSEVNIHFNSITPLNIHNSMRLDNKTNLMLGAAVHTVRENIIPEFSVGVQRQLSPSLVGLLIYRWSGLAELVTSLSYFTQRFVFSVRLGLSVLSPSVQTECTYSHPSGWQLVSKVSAGFRAMGLTMEYGMEKQLSELMAIGADVKINSLQGVEMKLRLKRKGQLYSTAFYLSEGVLPSSVAAATIAPLLIYWLGKNVLTKTFKKWQADIDRKKRQRWNAQVSQQKRREAERFKLLMTETYELSVSRESARKGLVIVLALYGKLVTVKESPRGSLYGNEVIDVTVPLQCIVSDSKLCLCETTKADLNGFYDPCISEQKFLKVRYMFKGQLHETTFRDDEPVNIPKKSHILQS